VALKEMEHNGNDQTAIISALSMAYRYSLRVKLRLLAVWRWVFVFLRRAIYWFNFL
jgi:hypothetical protein